MLPFRVILTSLLLAGLSLAQVQDKAAAKPPQPDKSSFFEKMEQQRKQRLETLNACLKAVQENPNSEEAYLKLGKAYIAKWLPQADDIENAIAAFQKALSIKPNYAEAYAGLGEVYTVQIFASEKDDSFERARGAYRQAIALKPDFAEAYRDLGYLYLFSEDVSAAEKAAADAFKEAIRLKPDERESYKGLAAAYEQMGDHKAAIDTLKKAGQLKPTTDVYIVVSADDMLQTLYTKLGQYDEALRIAEREIQAKPNDPFKYYALGDLYFDVGRYDDAIAAYKKGLSTKSEIDFMGYNGPQRLATLYVKLGRFEDAISACKEAIQADPKNTEAYTVMRDVYLKMERKKEAVEIIKQMVQAMPDRTLALYELGSTYLSIGDKKAAQGVYNQLHDMAQKAKEKVTKDLLERWATWLLEKIDKQQ